MRSSTSTTALPVNPAPVRLIVLHAVLLLSPMGCDQPIGLLFPSSTEPAPNDNEPGRASVITVTFANLTQAAVDVEFFVMRNSADLGSSAATPDDLFTEPNAVKRDIGLAGTGIVASGLSDTIQIPCGADLLLGTDGGRFLDEQSGDRLGEGERRWLYDGPLGLCGSAVTFEFHSIGDEFGTRVLVER